MALGKITPSGVCPPAPAKPRHRLKSTMTKLTAVDWGRGIEENQVPAYKLIPAFPHHCCDRTREPRSDTGGKEGTGTLMYHSSALRTLPLLQYENITNENPIDRSRFLLDKLQCFPLLFNCLGGKCEEQR